MCRVLAPDSDSCRSLDQRSSRATRAPGPTAKRPLLAVELQGASSTRKAVPGDTAPSDLISSGQRLGSGEAPKISAPEAEGGRERSQPTRRRY